MTFAIILLVLSIIALVISNYLVIGGTLTDAIEKKLSKCNSATAHSLAYFMQVLPIIAEVSVIVFLINYLVGNL